MYNDKLLYKVVSWSVFWDKFMKREGSFNIDVTKLYGYDRMTMV